MEPARSALREGKEERLAPSVPCSELSAKQDSSFQLAYGYAKYRTYLKMT